MPVRTPALASLAISAAFSLLSLTSTTATAVPSCLGRAVTIDLNQEEHANPDRDASDVILGTSGPDSINTGASTTGEGDVVCAKGGDDSIFGGAGSDIIDGGGGNDDIDGGDADTANDFSVYHGRTPSVVANLDGTAQLGSETDTLAGLEGLIGGSGNDTLVGDDNDNFLVGGNGSDLLKGGPGEDQFVGDDVFEVGLSDGPGGNGGDIINGGSDEDMVFYAGDHATGVVVVLGVAGASGNSTDGPSGSRDTLTGVENLQGTGVSDTLTGDAADNTFTGSGGADTLNGGGGADDLSGDGGADTLNGGPGPDSLSGGDGADKFFGQGGSDSLHAQDGFVDLNLNGGQGSDTVFKDDDDPAPINVP